MESSSRKIDADVFIDDRNVGGFPGWSEIWQMLNPDYADSEYNELSNLAKGNAKVGSRLKKLFQ
jgi:hypothetical protein